MLQGKSLALLTVTCWSQSFWAWPERVGLRAVGRIESSRRPGGAGAQTLSLVHRDRCSPLCFTCTASQQHRQLPKLLLADTARVPTKHGRRMRIYRRRPGTHAMQGVWLHLPCPLKDIGVPSWKLISLAMLSEASEAISQILSVLAWSILC